MPIIELEDLKLHYFSSGQGDNVVLVHGLGGNLAGWHLTMVPELQLEYRVITYDLRGHGRSDAPTAGYTTGDMAHDLLGILDKLGLEKTALVGHSWGADIALHFALLHPERVSELVIIEGALLAPLVDVYRNTDWEGWPYVTGTIEQLLQRPIPEEHRCDLEYLLRALIEIPIQYGPSQGRPRDEEVIFRVLDVLRPVWVGREADGNMSVDSIGKIACPTLLIYESNTVFRDAYRELCERLPASSSAILPAGKLKHFTSLEHPELILTNTKRFLKEQRTGLVDSSPAVK
jgi:pimeloyl-ACP methyl ester carboxylesterase